MPPKEMEGAGEMTTSGALLVDEGKEKEKTGISI